MKIASIITGTLLAIAAALLGYQKLRPENAPKQKYPATLTDLRWDTGDYIRWNGDQSAFPQRKENLSGMIMIVEPNGRTVAVEYIRPGYKRQHLKNARGKDDHALRHTKPGDTVQVYLCALTPSLRPDQSIRTNPQPLIWR